GPTSPMNCMRSNNDPDRLIRGATMSRTLVGGRIYYRMHVRVPGVGAGGRVLWCRYWAIDGHENVVAEICAELHVSRGRARGQLRYAIHLREKRVEVARVFRTGAIDLRMAIAIVNRV